MSGFEQRLSIAVQHEGFVIAKFQANGWTAHHFGQGQLPEECRSILCKWRSPLGEPSRIRWMPDVLAYTKTGTPSIALVDAKTGRSDTNNYDVEIAAVETARVFAEALRVPTFFVFHDFGVMDPVEVAHWGYRGPNLGNGSGTPYLLVPKCFSHLFDDVFPPTLRAAP